MIKGIFKVSSLLLMLTSILSLVLLFDRALRVSWVDPLYSIIDFYISIKYYLFSPLTWILEYLVQIVSSIFAINISLQLHWSDIFLLLLLYFSVRASTYWSSGLRGRAIFRYTWGFIISLVTGFSCGMVPLDNLIQETLLTLIISIGIALFEIGDCAISATFARKEELSWSEDFKRYAEFSFPPIIICVVTILLSFIFGQHFGKRFIDVTLFLFLFLFIIGIALYWLFRGWEYAGKKEYREEFESRWEKFRRSSNTTIGILMIINVGGALLFVLSNAGLKYIGV